MFQRIDEIWGASSRQLGHSTPIVTLLPLMLEQSPAVFLLSSPTSKTPET